KNATLACLREALLFGSGVFDGVGLCLHLFSPLVFIEIRSSKSEKRLGSRVGCRGENHSPLVHHLTLLHRSKQRKQSFPRKNHLCYLRFSLRLIRPLAEP